MTTYTFSGWILPADVSSNDFGPTTFTMVATDDYRFGFVPLGGDQNVSVIVLRTTAGSVFSSTINGDLVTPEWAVAMSRFDAPGGDAADTNAIYFGPTSGGALDNLFFFEIDGPRIGPLASVFDFGALIQTSPFNGLWTQPLLSNQEIDPGTFTSLTAVTQNDVINLTGQLWTGGTIRSGLGNDRVTGTSAADVIELDVGRDIGRGGNGADRILGQMGDDLLQGGRGNDTLNGGDGKDTLDSGAGKDSLVGGEKADVFVFEAGYGRDTISAFQDGVDKIDLSSFSLTQAQILADATEKGGNVQLNLGDDDVLVVLNITEAILRGDFIL
jgi:RTX calcium-binding nonapeptide repeat (4 copies)